MKNTNEPTKNIPSLEELMFEYDQLRREILQNDTQSIQILAGVVLLVSALTTIAFGGGVPSLLVKGILFLLAQVIACIGLWQTVQRTHTGFMIASYLRTFVEPKTAGLKWESRLKNFRRHIPTTSFSLRFGEFFIYQLLTYLFLIIVNFLLSAGYVIYELRLSPVLYLAIAIMVCVRALTVWFLWTSWRIIRGYRANSGETFDSIWQEVKDEEKQAQ